MAALNRIGNPQHRAYCDSLPRFNRWRRLLF